MEIKTIRRNNLIALVKNLLARKVYPYQANIAEATGIPNSYFSQMMMEPDKNGARSVTEIKARQIETALSLESGYLDKLETYETLTGKLNGETLVPDMEITNSVKMVLVPYLDVDHLIGIAAINADATTRNGFIFQKSYLDLLNVSSKVNESAVVLNESRCMMPTIKHNDLVLIDLRVNHLDDVVSGKVYAFIANNEIHIKRIFKLVNGDLRIYSDSGDKVTYPDEIVNKKDLSIITICGQVKWRSGEI